MLMRTLSKISAIAIACLALLVPGAAAGQTMRVHFIDVGQGAATLLEFPCAAVLVDAGGERNAAFDGTATLMRYLEDFFAGRPDLQRTLAAVVLSHPHKDHTLAVPQVLANYRVLNAVTNGMETGSGRHGQIALHNLVAAAEETDDPNDDVGLAVVWQKNIPRGKGLSNAVIDPVQCDTVDPHITALWGRVDETMGWNAGTFDNANNHSVVLRVDFGKASLLLSGDLEEKGIESLLAYYSGSDMLDVDVVQVNHHGSHNGTTERLLAATTPAYAVMGVGGAERELPWTAWAYGHPRKAVVDLLQKRLSAQRPAVTVPVASKAKTFAPYQISKAIYGTGWDGSVVMEVDAGGLWKTFDSAPAANKTDLNSASIEQLVKLPLIGPARARAIVQYREEHGAFQTVLDLQKIPGIKMGTVNAIRNLVTQLE